MNQLQPNQIDSFLRRFRFRKGTLRRIRLINRSSRQTDAEILLAVRTDESLDSQPGRVRLRLVLTGVEEYRFQRRPNANLVTLGEVRVGYFNGLFYLDLNAFDLEEGKPALHDFRASDAFAAARDFAWEIIPKKE